MGMGPEVWLPAGKGIAYAPAQLVPVPLPVKGGGKPPAEGHENPPPGCSPDAIKLFVRGRAALRLPLLAAHPGPAATACCVPLQRAAP
jgi:hypothetical protein